MLFHEKPKIDTDGSQIKAPDCPFVHMISWGVVFTHLGMVHHSAVVYNEDMAQNNVENIETPDEENTGTEYVTRDELTDAIADALKRVLGEGVEIPSSDEAGFDTDPEMVETESLNFSSADVERIAEKKVQEAIAQLMAKKTPAKTTTVKKSAPAAAIKKVEKVAEAEPTQPGKRSFSQRMWGTE